MAATQTVRAPITGAVLTWAMTIGGISRDELAQALGKPGRGDLIALWESEQEEPTIRQLSEVSNKLKRPIATFFLPSPPSEPDPTATFKRTVSLEASGFSSELRLAIRTTRYTRDRFVELLEESGTPPVCRIPVAKVDDDPEEVAAAVRQVVGVSVAQQMKWPLDDAYRLWCEALVGAGVLPQHFEVDSGQAWGFSITDGTMPVAAVNRKIRAKNAKIFTLWHEVGHVALRESSVSVLEPSSGTESSNAAETFCNRFAASFLLPLSSENVQLAIRNFQGASLTEDSIQKVATRFRVSKYVLLGRLLESKVVSVEAARAFRKEWWASDTARENDRVKREKEQRNSEKPPKIPRWKTAIWDRGELVAGTALEALSRGRVTTRTVSDLLGIQPQDIEKVERSLFRRGGE